MPSMWNALQCSLVITPGVRIELDQTRPTFKWELHLFTSSKMESLLTPLYLFPTLPSEAV